MTEIPEHLLKRSKERRAALGLPTDGGDAPAAAAPAKSETPATTPAAAPAAPAPAPAAPAPPPPPKPDPHYVAASKRRRRVPFWAMTALSILPLWAFMYVRSLTPADHAEAGPIGEGAEVYSACAGCHQADGSGGAGRPLSNGEVLLTFPNIEDQLNLVYTGSEAYALAELPGYGKLDRPGGPHLGFNGVYMPKFGGALTDAEILAVVCHERYDLGGADRGGEYAEEYEKWCSPESEVYAKLQDGSWTFETEELRIGTEPRPAIESGE